MNSFAPLNLEGQPPGDDRKTWPEPVGGRLSDGEKTACERAKKLEEAVVEVHGPSEYHHRRLFPRKIPAVGISKPFSTTNGTTRGQ